MPRKRIATLSSFEPELFMFWTDSLKSRITLVLPTYKNAVRLRHRLYSCRASMRAEGHPDIDSAERVVLSLEEQPDSRWAVVGDSVGAEFKDAFNKAGIVLPEPPPLEDSEPFDYAPDYTVKEDK